MPRKVTYEQTLVAHGWVALDPVDTGVIEKLFKKDIREGEEKLMLAVLENAVEYFQKYVLARKRPNRFPVATFAMSRCFISSFTMPRRLCRQLRAVEIVAASACPSVL